jgi:hypothetical protein
MPRYLFHIHDGWEVVPDEEGLEFPDQCLAEVEGYDSARDLALAAESEGRSVAAYAVEIRDEAGLVLRRIKVAPIYRTASQTLRGFARFSHLHARIFNQRYDWIVNRHRTQNR